MIFRITLTESREEEEHRQFQTLCVSHKSTYKKHFFQKRQKSRSKTTCCDMLRWPRIIGVISIFLCIVCISSPTFRVVSPTNLFYWSLVLQTISPIQKLVEGSVSLALLFVGLLKLWSANIGRATVIRVQLEWSFSPVEASI